MKKMMCLLLAAAMLCCAASATAGWLARTEYGEFVEYENRVFGYSLGMYEAFIMYPDSLLEQIMGEANLDEEADELYDLRCWVAPDSQYSFQVQVKEPTYDSFETEVAKAGDYLSLVLEDMTAQGCENIVQLHEGILRDTPEGPMLETAVAYDIVQDGQYVHVISMYYDCYRGDTEYIFQLSAYDQPYEDAQALLDTVVQTVRIGSGDAQV